MTDKCYLPAPEDSFPRPSPQSLGTLGAFFVQSLEITNPDECLKWGTILQCLIEIAESQQDPILPSLLQLKEMTYKKWFKPTWKDAP